MRGYYADKDLCSQQTIEFIQNSLKNPSLACKASEKSSICCNFSKYHAKSARNLDLNLYLYTIKLIQMEENRDLNRLKVVLADKKRTNKWLAEQLGKDPTTVSKWCTNTCQPDLGNLMKISQLLEVDLNELLRFNN